MKRFTRHSPQGLLQSLLSLEPRTPDQLHRLVERLLGLRLPRRALIEGNDAPFDYLVHSFFETKPAGGDVIVWANRGGGKTMLGAVATLLDLVFKPGIQVRILGGSFEQSSKMYAYLRKLLDEPTFRPLLRRDPTQRRIELIHGSCVELLSQSQKSVRGQRIQKLRCDEIEEFEPEVWNAAQMVTRSVELSGKPVRGSIHALSTMHRPFGLMHKLVGAAGEPSPNSEKPDAPAMTMLRWCAIDVIERCPEQRKCESCALWTDCLGKAKEAHGFMAIDDLIAQKSRISAEVWDTEMMCKRPKRTDTVFPAFDVARHVRPLVDPQVDSPIESRNTIEDHQIIAGADFGLRSPMVMLWARVPDGFDHRNGYRQTPIEVIGEYVGKGKTLHQNLDAIAERNLPTPTWVGVDPAGRQRNPHSGQTDIQVMQQRGYTIRSRGSRIRDGIEMIRRRLEQGTLTIASDCTQLIEAMSTYHFDPLRPHDESPIKDGADHACDALRYMILNLETGASVNIRKY